jgi:hypothetical protein
MREICRYYKFLGDDLSLDILVKAKDGFKSPEDISGFDAKPLTKKRYYNRVSNARKLGLIFRCNGGYRLTSFGRLFLRDLDRLVELKPVEWMLRSIDAIDDDGLKLKMIHQLFSKQPDIRDCLIGDKDIC